MGESGVCIAAIIVACAACGEVASSERPGDAGAATTHVITIQVSGGPGGVMLTPTSPTPGAICMPGRCEVPSGGAISVEALGLIDWFFDGWSDGVTSDRSMVSLSDITGDVTLTASYVNTRMGPCADAPPANGHSTGTTDTRITYTTAGGWSAAGQCPWACDTEFCAASGACTTEFVDQISLTTGTASKWFGGDDRSSENRSVGTGQGVTPGSTVTMNRFGFELQGAFKFASAGQPFNQPVALQLDRRDAAGNVVASYQTTVPASFSGGWVYWNTPATTLNASTLYIFTAFVPAASSIRVNTGTLGDANATYAGGSGYDGEGVPGTDLSSFSNWGVHPWDFLFRVQQRNPSCQ